MSLDLSIYSKYRTQIMGIAAIMIIVCHIRGVDFSTVPFLEKILWIGNYGVELFLFVSGIGMYYSLQKTPDKYQWYKRRYIRILVPFFLITATLYPLRYIFGINANLPDFVLHITTAEYWLYHRGAWYVAMIFPLYFVTPYITNIIKGGCYVRVFTITVLSAVLLCISMIPNSNNIISNIQFVTARIPIYIFGIGIAPLVQSEYKLRGQYVCLIILGGILLWHYCKVSIAGAIVVVLLVGYLISTVSKFKVINTPLSFMGSISIESYLTNIYLGSMIMNSTRIDNITGGGRH